MTQNKAGIDKSITNFDTLSTKTVNNENQTSAIFDTKVEISTENNEFSSSSNNERAALSSNNCELVENRLENQENSNGFEQNSKSQNSHTSKISTDPLSQIESSKFGNLVYDSNLSDDEILVFSKLFPSTSLEKIKEDELFCLFSSHNGNKLTISNLYSNYLRFVQAIENNFAKKSLVSLQNKLISPGSLVSNEKSSEIFFTKEQVLKMSPGQIAKYYNIIRDSQQKW